MDAALLAASHPVRRRILERLRRGPAAMGTLAKRFPVSRQAVAKHLRLLERGRLIVLRRRGRERIARLSAAPLREIDRWVEKFRSFWEPRLRELKRLAEERER